MAELIVYPDAHVENTSVDSYTIRYGVDETWATIVGGAGNWAADSANVLVLQMIASTTSGQWERFYRNIILFDTSALGNGAIISSAILSLYGDLKDDGLSATPNANIYTSTPNSETTIVTGDHVRIGTAAQCDTPITYAGWSTSGYNAFTLNAAGLASINKTGRTKFALRNANYDVAEEVGGSSSPPWISGASSQLRAHSADNASGTSKAPKLVITYSVGATVTTQECTDTTARTSTGHGLYSAEGDSSVIQHGHVRDTSANPTTSDSSSGFWGKTENGAAPNLGQFSSNLTNLTPNTLYYVAAYVTNTGGTSYGSDVTITTGTTIGKRYIWTEGTDFHYFDAYGTERVLQGHAVASDKDILPWLAPWS